MSDNEKAAPNAPTTIGAEQSNQSLNNSIIAENSENFKCEEVDYQEIIRRMTDPYYIHVMTLSELYDTVYENKLPIIDGLLYAGVYLFVGAPKVGKSFLMAQLAYHVSMGKPMWEYNVHKYDVAYFALEDDFARIQKRLYRMFGSERNYNL